jgi:hypothetical protein
MILSEKSATFRDHALARRRQKGSMDETDALATALRIVFITGLIGGGAAWLSGRAIAQTWRPIWHVAGYMLLIGLAVRFVHFALFEADLVSPLSYALDTLYLEVVGCLGWQITRANQMVTQYPWLYERVTRLTWRERTPAQ